MEREWSVRPMIWREHRNHHDDFYFCVVKINENNPGNRSKCSYPHLSSSQRPQFNSREEQPSTSKYSDDPNLCKAERNTSKEYCDPDYKFILQNLKDLIREN